MSDVNRDIKNLQTNLQTCRPINGAFCTQQIIYSLVMKTLILFCLLSTSLSSKDIQSPIRPQERKVDWLIYCLIEMRVNFEVYLPVPTSKKNKLPI